MTLVGVKSNLDCFQGFVRCRPLPEEDGVLCGLDSKRMHSPCADGFHGSVRLDDHLMVQKLGFNHTY
jgi:hypothetical protein